MPTLTMQINGGAVSRCSDLGWSLESLTRRNLAPDVVSLRRVHHNALSLAQGDVVVIWADGTRIFTGTAQQPRISHSDGAATVTAQILGPWWHLDQMTFTRGQPRTQGTGATATAVRTGSVITAINVTAGGSGYLSAYVVFTGGGGGAGCAARVNVSAAGAVTSIVVLDGGSGWVSTPTVTIVGLTYLPPALGDTFSIGPSDGVQVWNPTTETWITPGSPTTYKWAREDDFGATPKEIDLARYFGSRGLLCDPNHFSAIIYRPVADELRELLEYIRLSRSRLSLAAAFTCDLDGIETGLGPSASPKYRTWGDTKVGPLIASLLAVKPDLAAWFDYSQETPELLMRVASLETETELTLGQAPLISLDASPRAELAPAGIVIRWEYPDATPWDWRGFKLAAHCDKSPADILPHEPGVLTYTQDLPTDLSTFKPDLAASLLTSLSTLRVTGSMTLGRMTLSEALAVRPGLCYRLAGDLALAESQMLVQETTWSPATNQVQCTLGYPRALDMQTLSDLRGWLSFVFEGPGYRQSVIIPPPP